MRKYSKIIVIIASYAAFALTALNIALRIPAYTNVIMGCFAAAQQTVICRRTDIAFFHISYFVPAVLKIRKGSAVNMPKILIVDDEKMIRNVVKEYAEFEGYGTAKNKIALYNIFVRNTKRYYRVSTPPAHKRAKSCRSRLVRFKSYVYLHESEIRVPKDSHCVYALHDP